MDTVAVFIHSMRANTLTHSLIASQIWDSRNLKKKAKIINGCQVVIYNISHCVKPFHTNGAVGFEEVHVVHVGSLPEYNDKETDMTLCICT